jgi:formamidopyrimidine-DNA glycosylase
MQLASAAIPASLRVDSGTIEFQSAVAQAPESRETSMPELPEVETVRRSLLNRIVGQQIRGLRIGDFPGVLQGERVEDVQPRIHGRTVRAVRRRAKYLIIELDDDTAIVVHLRMTGRLSAVPHDEPSLRFERLAIEFDNELDLRFSDQRKFGRVVHLHHDDVKRLEERLGREPLTSDFSAAWLEERLRRRPGKVKAVILDQGLIGGLGNIYADEALFRARIHPERRANTLTADEVRRLHRAIRAVLKAAVDGRGTTFSTFEDAGGNRGRYGGRLQVYGRGGKGRCPSCDTPLERIVVGGRGTSFCPSCQPLDMEIPGTG